MSYSTITTEPPIPNLAQSLPISECVIRPELIPDHVREDIGRVGLEAVIRFYQNPENERRFQEWLPGYLARQAEKAKAAQKGGQT